ALWGAPLVTDSLIFLFTVIRTIRYKRNHGFTSTVQIILRDGTIYFFVIFSMNLMNCLIYLLAVEDLKAVGASFSQILTSILISRLQLNLHKLNSSLSSLGHHSPQVTRKHIRNNTDVGQTTTTFFTIGNLGEELEGDLFFSEKEKQNERDEEFELSITVPLP
ncbi:hypothetical protein M422DRAFT_181420, partial [Sphaerobolus stellatus SS14]